MKAESKGTRIVLDFSFFAVICLMLLFCEKKVVTVCLLSSAFHELGHLFLMWAFKEKAEKIVFGAFGIRIEKNPFSPLSYKKEAVIALGGIAADFLLAALLLAVCKLNGSTFALQGALVNIFIAALNLIPVGMLDSGNFLRYILLEWTDEERAYLMCRKISDISVLLFGLSCVFYTAFFSLNISFIALTVYLIILNLTPGRK